jgi:4-hydroxy-tetrahydrodipicolinate reductase
MNIALIGYGKIGRTIEMLGKRMGHQFPLVIDLDNQEELTSGKLKEMDVAIEFTVPRAAAGNIMACIDQGVPVVSGTTGWNTQFHEVEDYCLRKDGGWFQASNFSIGVNILFALNRMLARIMDQFPQYGVRMEEVHHVHKLDAPSGTAITLAEQILKEINRLDRWELAESGETPPSNTTGSFPVHALREGEVMGRHTVQYESEVDSITLVHNAKSRDAFAIGALMAAEFMIGKHGIYGMKDLLKF